jgi:hypothetical protein
MALKESYFRDHPGHLYSFSPANIEALCRYAGLMPRGILGLDFLVLPKLGLGFLCDLVNSLPCKRALVALAIAYWYVATGEKAQARESSEDGIDG